MHTQLHTVLLFYYFRHSASTHFSAYTLVKYITWTFYNLDNKSKEHKDGQIKSSGDIKRTKS